MAKKKPRVKKDLELYTIHETSKTVKGEERDTKMLRTDTQAWKRGHLPCWSQCINAACLQACQVNLIVLMTKAWSTRFLVDVSGVKCTTGSSAGLPHLWSLLFLHGRDEQAATSTRLPICNKQQNEIIQRPALCTPTARSPHKGLFCLLPITTKAKKAISSNQSLTFHSSSCFLKFSRVNL